MERDENGHINSKRQREITLTGQLDRQRSVRVTWKAIGIRGSGNKSFVTTVTYLDHVHELSSNPHSFPRHRQSLEEWQALIRAARKHREAVRSLGIAHRCRRVKLWQDLSNMLFLLPERVSRVLRFLSVPRSPSTYQSRRLNALEQLHRLLELLHLSPVSTAPPTLGGSLGKRKRTITARYKQGEKKG